MPRYVIERQYLVAIYEHICVEAESLEDACRQAVDDIQHPWSENAEMDFDTARPTTVAQAVEIPDGRLPEVEPTEDRDRDLLSDALYQSGLPLLQIPKEFSDGAKSLAGDVGFI